MHLKTARRPGQAVLNAFCMLVFCILLVGCEATISTGSLDGGSGSSGSCLQNCTVGPGVSGGLSVIVEPEAKDTPLVNAIRDAKKSVWLEMYLLTNKDIMTALEDDANNGIDVRVMLEQHPLGTGGVSPSETLDKLKAAGIKAQFTNPAFALTHEKGMVIDNTTAFIMTSNFTNAALGTGSSTLNREYDIVDTNSQDVQAVAEIFQADWNRSTASFNAPNLVVSPINSRTDFSTLIGSAKKTLLIEAEEMNDSSIEQAIVDASQRGVQVQVILPAPSSSKDDSNQDGITAIKKGNVAVKEDHHRYMHAKIIVVDGKEAYVGSENISGQSLDKNRELGLILSDTSVLNTLEQTFQTDWGDSRSV